MTLNWNQIEQKRRNWEPNNPPPSSETCLDPLTISRCLALTALEPQVADFIKAGLSTSDLSKIPAEAIKTLQLNIADEERHEVALTRARRALKDYDKSQEIVGDQIVQRWKEVSGTPIVVTAVLEMSVFMLMLVYYSRFGSGSLRVSAQDISPDEVRHSNVNREISILLGDRPTKAVSDLRKDTVAWLFEHSNIEGFDQARMLKNSESLLKRGVSDFLESSEGVVYAPFEMPKSIVSGYA